MSTGCRKRLRERDVLMLEMRNVLVLLQAESAAREGLVYGSAPRIEGEELLFLPAVEHRDFVYLMDIETAHRRFPS